MGRFRRVFTVGKFDRSAARLKSFEICSIAGLPKRSSADITGQYKKTNSITTTDDGIPIYMYTMPKHVDNSYFGIPRFGRWNQWPSVGRKLLRAETKKKKKKNNISRRRIILIQMYIRITIPLLCGILESSRVLDMNTSIKNIIITKHFCILKLIIIN